MNAIGTQLRGPINSGPTDGVRRFEQMDAAAEVGSNPVSKHPVQPEYRESGG